MADGVKKYRRPDGTTYSQYGGPKSSQDVEVKEAPSATPSPSPSPTPKAGSRSTTTMGSDPGTIKGYEKVTADKAQREAEHAEDIEKVAPWLGEKPKQVEGGIGGAAARQKAMRGVSSTAAGDALAEADEKKKKKKGDEEQD